MWDTILLTLILVAWVFQDFMTWGPLSPQTLAWFKPKVKQNLDYQLAEDFIHTETTWAIDLREGVNDVSSQGRKPMSSWDIAA